MADLWPRPGDEFTLEREKGCVQAAALLKEASNSRKYLVNAILPVPSTDARSRDAGNRALDHFLGAGFSRIEPPVLQPAAAFLDMSGEEIRGRLYLTSDASGAELCLRPEYTDPRVPRASWPRRSRAPRRNTPISARFFARARARAGR